MNFFSTLSTFLPLLRKDLYEKSLHKRTYILRVLYAIVFYSIFFYWWAYYNNYDSAGQSFGHGKDLFKLVYIFQFLSIFIMLPAMMAGAIAKEREQHNLPLLIISKLHPWEIILEKYFSHLLPMATFILMTIPAVGLSYAMGGITQTQIFNQILVVVLCLFVVAAISIACSSVCKTTARSITSCYILVGVFYWLAYNTYGFSNFSFGLGIFFILLFLFIARYLLNKTIYLSAIGSKEKSAKTSLLYSKLLKTPSPNEKFENPYVL